MNVCTPPQTGPVGSPLVAFAFRSSTQAVTQYVTSALSPVTATGANVPFPLVFGIDSLVVVICEVLKVSHGAYA